MKKNRKTFAMLTILVSVAGFASTPGDGDNLYVWTKNGSRTVYSLDNFDKLTFEESTMSVWKNNGKTSYAYSNIGLVTFKDGIKPTTGIEQLSKEGDEINIRYNREMQVVTLYSERTLNSLQVLDLQGRLVAMSNAKKGNSELSVSHLPQGVYVVKAVGPGLGKSVKIIK